jgi:hypothetical protein
MQRIDEVQSDDSTLADFSLFFVINGYEASVEFCRSLSDHFYPTGCKRLSKILLVPGERRDLSITARGRTPYKIRMASLTARFWNQ